MLPDKLKLDPDDQRSLNQAKAADCRRKKENLLANRRAASVSSPSSATTVTDSFHRPREPGSSTDAVLPPALDSPTAHAEPPVVTAAAAESRRRDGRSPSRAAPAPTSASTGVEVEAVQAAPCKRRAATGSGVIALRSSNRAKLVATIFRKKATKGFKSLNGMQRAILYDAHAQADRTGASLPSLADSVHVDDWEEEGFGTTASPLSEAQSEDVADASDVEVGPATVDEEFAESYLVYAATAAAAAAEAEATAERLATKRCAPDADVDLRDLQLNQAWEKAFLRRTRNLNPAEDDQPALEEEDDDPNLSSTVLQDLLELTEDGIAVVWPPGIDARIARLILHRRRSMTNAKRQCDRAAPA